MAGRAPTAAEIQQVLSRGYTQDDINRFNASNPGDGGRILTAFPAQRSGGGTYTNTYPVGGGAGAAAPAGGGGASGGGGAPAGGATGAGAAMAGLNKVVDPGATKVGDPSFDSSLGGVGAGGGGGAGMQEANVGGQMLRGLGRRTMPIESAALAGLRSVY